MRGIDCVLFMSLPIRFVVFKEQNANKKKYVGLSKIVFIIFDTLNIAHMYMVCINISEAIRHC